MRYKDKHQKDVVCSIITRHEDNTNFFLIRKRSGTSVLGGLYEFPGGKGIRGKSLRIALKREICEELGAEIDVTGFFMYPFSYDYSKDDDGFEAYFKLFPMLCTLQANNPDPSAREGIHDILRWVSANALHQYDMLGADMAIVSKIQMDHFIRCSSRSLEN